MFREYEDDDDYHDDDDYEMDSRDTNSGYGIREVPKPVRESEYETTTTSSYKNQTAKPSAPPYNNSSKSGQIQVVVIKPQCYEDAQEICDQVKTKRPVIVNLEKVEYPVAQRIMDFLSGTCYSLDGNIQRVANNIFIIAPDNVDITGNFKEELKSKGVLLPWMNNGK